MTAIELDPSFEQPVDFSDRIIDLFISFYQEVFKHMDEFRYSDDEKLTRLLIYDKFAKNLDTVGKKPSLVTDLKSINKGNTVINDFVGNADFFQTGNKMKTDLFSTVLIVHAMSAVQAESRRLAFLAGFSIFGLEEELFKKGIFELSVPTVVGEPRKLVTSSEGEIWSTPTTIQVYFQDSWVTKIINSDILQRFATKVNILAVSC